MRELTADQEALLARGRAAFEVFVRDAGPLVDELVSMLAPHDVEACRANLEVLLPPLERLLANEVLDPDALARAGTRVTFVVAEFLRRSFGGVWALDDVPGSPSFAHPVIDIPLRGPAHLRVDPGRLAYDFLLSPPPRSLFRVLEPVLENVLRGRRERRRTESGDGP